MKKLYTYKKIAVGIMVLSLPLLFGNLSEKKYLFKSSGAHPGSTGAPGDVTCSHAGCHADATVNKNVPGINSIIFPTADTTYVPGQAYNVTLKVQKGLVQRFGFELCVLANSNDQDAGIIELTDAVRTQLLTHTVSGNIRNSITHTTNGNPATPNSGQTYWSFKWTAPSTNVGKVTMYYCTNCTNKNNANTGDELYLNSFTIKPSSGIGIAEFIEEKSCNVYFDQSNKQIVLNYNLMQDKLVGLSIIDAEGREIVNPFAQQKNKGNNSERISLNNTCAGVYFVKVLIDGNTLTKKLLIQ